MNTSEHDENDATADDTVDDDANASDHTVDDNDTAGDSTNSNAGGNAQAQQSVEQDRLWWHGALAGVAAGGVALMFGQLVEALSETIPRARSRHG